MNENNYLKFGIIFAISCALILGVNKFIVRSVKNDKRPRNIAPASVSRALKFPDKDISSKAPQIASGASDPAAYGISVYRDDFAPASELQWDTYTKKNFVSSEALERMESEKKLEALKKTAEEFKTRIDEIDQRIDKYELIKRNNPGDQEARDKLENLYMLKATLTALKDKIIKSDPRKKSRSSF